MIRSELVTAARAGLAAAADPAKAPGMQRYMRSEMPFYGVQAPVVRNLIRRLVDEHPLETWDDWADSIRALYDGATHREERYVALGLAGHRRYRRYRDVGSLDLYRHLAVTGAWWDLVDTVAGQVGEVLREHRADAEPVLLGWATEADPWLRRVAILAQLKHRDATDRRLLEDTLTPNLDDRDFFIRKAIGWALREFGKTDPAWVRAYVEAHRGRMSALSAREALKHIGG